MRSCFEAMAVEGGAGDFVGQERAVSCGNHLVAVFNGPGVLRKAAHRASQRLREGSAEFVELGDGGTHRDCRVLG
jgi:hypothetical protein